MSKASLELGGGNWAAKDTKLLGYAVGDTSGKYLPREFTFSRGADIAATRVNKDGLIEKYRENVLLNSDDFSIAGASGGWVKNNSTATSGYAGYDGTTNAWKLESTAETSFNNLNQQAANNAAITPLGSKVATFSVYLKAGTTNWARLNLNLTGNVYFDLENGVVGTATANILGQIESAGNGFYRCSITRLGGGVFDGCYIYLAESDGSLLPNTHPTPEHIFVQHPQLEYGLVATDYIETDSSTASAGVLDDLPRIDYTSGSAQLLMEPSRTNYLEQSEYFADTSWTKLNVDADASNIASPEGKSNSYKITETTANNYHAINVASASRPTLSAGSHTHSCFVKANGVNDIVFYNNGTSGAAGVDFDLSAESYSNLVNSATDASIESYGNGWYRISMTFTASAGTTSPTIYLRTLSTYAGDGVSGIYMYGMQTEAGSYATSYIPTYGASDTRAFDNVQELTSTSSTGITNNYNTTVFFDGSVFRNTDNARIATLYDSSVASNPRVLLYLTENSGNHRVIVQYRVSGQADVSTATGYDYDIGDRVKMAMRLDDTSLDLFVNGVKQSTATIVQGDPIEVLRLMDVNADLGHFFNDFQVFSSSLSDPECIALTTL